MSTALLRLYLWLQTGADWVGAHMDAARNREDGQGLVEYALIIALVAILIITALFFLKNSIVNIFDKIGNSLSNCAGGC